MCAPPFRCNAGSECPAAQNEAGGCDNFNQCVQCNDGSVSKGNQPCRPCNRPGEAANPSRDDCIPCGAGQEPAGATRIVPGIPNRTACVDCTGNFASLRGVECLPCVVGYAPGPGHVTCDDVNECTPEHNNGHCDELATIGIGGGVRIQ